MLKSNDVIDERYKIIEQIGTGGSSVIYKALQINLNKYVAIKLINDMPIDLLEKRSEIDLMKNLKSKYLPTFYDIIVADNHVYTVMEYINGLNLEQAVEQSNAFDEKSIIKYGIQLCEAVNELHSQTPPIIHGDIKPANIMITNDDNICLIDFNISVIMYGSNAAAKGYSPEFAAPEQFNCSDSSIENETENKSKTKFLFSQFKDDSSKSNTKYLFDNKNNTEKGNALINIQTDIYSVGAILYYLVSGKKPNNFTADLSNVKISDKLAEIIQKAMHKEPECRYTSAEQLKSELENIGSEKSKKKPSIKKAVAIAAITAAALCIAILSLYLSEHVVVYNEAAYILVEKELSWNEAEKYCQKLGGHLVSINSAEEQNVVLKLAKNTEKDILWTGGKCDPLLRKWSWSDGSEFKYTNWNENQPDCYKNIEFTISFANKKIYYDTWCIDEGCWNDAAENSKYPFICEIRLG